MAYICKLGFLGVWTLQTVLDFPQQEPASLFVSCTLLVAITIVQLLVAWLGASQTGFTALSFLLLVMVHHPKLTVGIHFKSFRVNFLSTDDVIQFQILCNCTGLRSRLTTQHKRFDTQHSPCDLKLNWCSGNPPPGLVRNGGSIGKKTRYS